MAKNNRRARPGNTRVPTPEEVKAARVVAGDTQAQASARILGGEKAFEQYEITSPSQNRRMHPGLFKLYLILTGQPVPKWLEG